MQFPFQNPQILSAFLSSKGKCPFLHKFFGEIYSSPPTLPKETLKNKEIDHDDDEKKTSHISSRSKKISKAAQNNEPREETGRRRRRELWKPQEDEILLDLIRAYGFKWSLISKEMGWRSGKQVRDRYMNFLRPGIKSHGSWTKEEDERFKSLYFTYGNRWSIIAEHLPGRSECQVKNRYYSYLKEHIFLEEHKEELTKSESSITTNQKVELEETSCSSQEKMKEEAIKYEKDGIKSEEGSIKYEERLIKTEEDYVKQDEQDSVFKIFIKADPESAYNMKHERI